jgi:hypothetical protein
MTAVAMEHFVPDALPHAAPALQRSWQVDARFLEMFGVTL